MFDTYWKSTVTCCTNNVDSCFISAPLLLLRRLSSTNFQSLPVSQGSVTPDQISTFFQYIKAYKPILTQYHQELTSTASY